MNAQGVTGNFELIEDLVTKTNLDFLLLTETHLTENVEPCELCLTGYKHYCCLSVSRHTGGVSIYVKESFKSSQKNSFIRGKQIWILSVKITHKRETWNLIVVYRSGVLGVSDFFEILNDWVPRNIDENEHVLVAGDFNIDFSDGNNYEVNHVNRFLCHVGLKQLVEEPTRITLTSNTLIDYVLADFTVMAEVSVRKEWKISEISTNLPSLNTLNLI